MRLAAETALPNMQKTARPLSRLKRFFTEAEIVELTMVTAVLTGMAKMLFVFYPVSREATCAIRPSALR